MKRILVLCILAFLLLPSMAAETTHEYGDGTVEIKDGPLFRRVSNMATVRNWNGEYAPAPVYFINIGDYVAESTTSNYRIQFQNSPKTKLISMNTSELELEISVDGFTQTVNGNVQNPFSNSLSRWANHIYYNNGDTNISYTLTKSGIKEDIIIKNPIPEFVNEGHGIMLRYSVQATNSILYADGSPVTSPQTLHNKKILEFKHGNLSYQLGLPTMESESMLTTILDYTIDPIDIANGKYGVFVNIDTSDLTNADNYPITIDPTVTTLSTGTPTSAYVRAYSSMADNAILTGPGIVSGWNNTSQLPTSYYQDISVVFTDAELWYETKYNATYLVCGYEDAYYGWVGLFDVNGSSGQISLQFKFPFVGIDSTFLTKIAYDNRDLTPGEATYYIAGRKLPGETTQYNLDIIWKVDKSENLPGGYDIFEWSNSEWISSLEGNVIKDIDYINSINTLVVTSREHIGTVLGPDSWLMWTPTGDFLHRYDGGLDDGDVDSPHLPQDGGANIYSTGHTGASGTDGVLVGYDATTYNSILYHTLPSNVGPCFGIALESYSNRAWISCRHSLLSTESWILEMDLLIGANNPIDYVTIPGRVSSLVGVNDFQGLIGVNTPGIVVLYGIDTIPKVVTSFPPFGQEFTPVTGIQTVAITGTVYSNETQNIYLQYWVNDTADNIEYTGTKTLSIWNLAPLEPLYTYSSAFIMSEMTFNTGEWHIDIVIKDGLNYAKNESYFIVVDTAPEVTITNPEYSQKFITFTGTKAIAISGIIYSNETQDMDFYYWVNYTNGDTLNEGTEPLGNWEIAPGNPTYDYKASFGIPEYLYTVGEWRIDVLVFDGTHYASNQSYFVVTEPCLAQIIAPINHSTHTPGPVLFEGSLASAFDVWQGLDKELDNLYEWKIYGPSAALIGGSSLQSFAFTFVEEGEYNITFSGFDGLTNSGTVWKHITIYDPPDLPDIPPDDGEDFIPDDDGGDAPEEEEDAPDIVETAAWYNALLEPFNTLIMIIVGLITVIFNIIRKR